MKSEQIIINKITAAEGMVLTDGDVYGTEIFLGVGRTADEFTEITQAEYDEIISETEREV